MTFDKQVKEAKKNQLMSRITRDIVFMVLGIIFLAISIFLSYKDSKNNESNNVNKTTVKETTKR